MKKRIICIFLAISMILALAACRKNDNGKLVTEDPAFTEKELPVLRNDTDSTETAKVRIYEDMPDVPYINVESFYDQFFLVNTDLTDGMSCSRDGSKYTLTNTGGDTAIFDVAAETIVISNVDAFVLTAFALKIDNGTGVDENHPYIKMSDVYAPADPAPKTIDLKDYGIDLRGDDTGVYAPVATLADLFSSVETYHVVYFGGKIYTADFTGVYVPGSVLRTYPDYIADVETDRSPALADFTYRELCFNLDLWYGQPGQEWAHEDLKTMKFDELLTTKYPEIREMLLSTDFRTFYTGIMNLINGILFDGGHTTLAISRLFAGDPELSGAAAQGMMDKEYALKFLKTQTIDPMQTAYRIAARDAAYGDNFYLEQGDTAMIRFDSFVTDYDGWKAFYAGTGERPLKFGQPGAEQNDTVGVVLTALERAKQNPEIKNIIIDMSCNGGGDSGAMMAVEWLLTGSGYSRFESKMTDRIKTSSVQFDMNFDGKFDENDVSPYTGYKFGVLTSSFAFSCANAFPWFMRDHGAVIFGQKTSGGACAIRISSAGGVEFACSSASSAIINDSGENVDFGCPVDFDLISEGENPYENFYDLENLSRLMNG